MSVTVLLFNSGLRPAEGSGRVLSGASVLIPMVQLLLAQGRPVHFLSLRKVWDLRLTWSAAGRRVLGHTRGYSRTVWKGRDIF